MSAETKVGKVAEWKRRLRRYERTELTVAEFCRQEGISVSSLYQWMRTLAGMPQGNASELKANRNLATSSNRSRLIDDSINSLPLHFLSTKTHYHGTQKCQ